ncbi:MAG: sulfatase-like hydrolase/transferase, partial [Acidobacteria bacterium]|nr:sulfatase-like hydrolase/transferase [Acidobacteriota bacterium]
MKGLLRGELKKPAAPGGAAGFCCFEDNGWCQGNWGVGRGAVLQGKEIFRCRGRERGWGGGVRGQVETPHVDRLASRGVRFKSAYRPAPVCVASWGSLITGLYPPRWEAKFLEDALPAGTRKIARYCGGTAHNGLASARQAGRVPRPLVPGLRGLCALFGTAHNGLAAARRGRRVPRPLVPGLRGLCALFGTAHNGLAAARRDGRVPRPLVPGLRGLCAL